VKSILKKGLAAVAITKGIGKVQEMRRPPRRSAASRVFPVIALAGLGLGVFYLSKSGQLQPLIARAKDMVGGNDNDAVLEDSLRAPTAEPPGQTG
jgi:hypothetical protein